MASSVPSLKSDQLAAVHRMLALNEDPPPSSSSSSGVGSTTSDPSSVVDPYYPAGSGHNRWKILVYDAPCRSIISPLMSVSNLRSRGVTLHLLLSSEREPIPDVPAVYFVRPTSENLSIIARDAAAGLYSRLHLNFVTKLPRDGMEELARSVVQTNSLDKIASVHDQYLDYVCLERGLFSLNRPRSYVTYNRPDATERDMEDAMTDVASGLFSAVATRGAVPVIRCPRGGAPEMVARKLNKMIAEHPNLGRKKGVGVGGGGYGGGGGGRGGSHHRPLLVILDRNEDLITPIQHTSTYQALIDDVLRHSANRVEFTVDEDGGSKTGEDNKPARRRRPPVEKRFDLDPDSDPFYGGHKFNTFPDAIESNGRELQDVTAREAEVRSKTSGGGGGATDSSMPVAVDDSAAGTDLAHAVDSLPALLERKKQLEVHTSILQAVMNEVAARDVPAFYELESSLATGAYRNDVAKAKKDVTDMVSDPAKGNVQDKVRLISVFCLATTCPSGTIDEVVESMKASYRNLPPDHQPPVDQMQIDTALKSIDYLKRLRSMHLLPSMGEGGMLQSDDTSSGGAGGGGPPSSGNAPTDMLSSFMARAQTQATGLLAKATERVGTMLGKVHKHHATRVVENLMGQRPGTEDETYLYLDPKVKGDVDVAALRGVARVPTGEAVAFVVGGGCYAEYQNLQMLASAGDGGGGGGRTVSYGSTELVDPEVFLGQLGELA